MDYESIFQSMIADERYQQNLDWGTIRPGHPEGTIRAHIAQLEANLELLEPKLRPVEVWKLRLLIHAHDTFKPNARSDARIVDPDSHASLARSFLAQYCPDDDLLAIVQYHDEPFALWQQYRARRQFNHQRFEALFDNIKDWDLFLAFTIIDGCTPGKNRQPLVWLFAQIAGRVKSRFSESDIIDTQ